MAHGDGMGFRDPELSVAETESCSCSVAKAQPMAHGISTPNAAWQLKTRRLGLELGLQVKAWLSRLVGGLRGGNFHLLKRRCLFVKALWAHFTFDV